MPIPGFLKNIFAGGAGELVKSIGDAADKIFTSKEEKEVFKQELIKEVNRNMDRLEELSLQETQAHLADVQSARESNTRIQESEKASWLSKNVGYILDLSVSALFYTMLFMIFFVTIPEANKEIFYTAFGVLGAKYGSSFDFHRGSSAGSKASGDAIRKMVGK